MPEKKTIDQARRARRAGKSPSTQAGAFVHEEIEHIREGKHGARSAKQAIAAVDENIEGLRFNVAVAKIYELANAVASARSKPNDSDGSLFWALREAGQTLVQLIAPMMPHLAEECWARLGYNTLLAKEPWPEADPALLVDDQVTIAVQVNGKRRDELVISRTAKTEDVEAAALKLEPVIRALEGRPVKKVIVVPQRIVNVVG